MAKKKIERRNSKSNSKKTKIIRPLLSHHEDRTIYIGIFGLGAVGSGVVELLKENSDIIWKRCHKSFRIAKGVVKSPRKKRPFKPDFPISDRPDFILHDPNIDVILELTGGKKLPEKIFRHCIINKKPIVTANKAFLAENANLLGKLFQKQRTCIGMEASVAGAVPILQSLRYGLSANDISGVYGIVNGTANYILTAMQRREIGFSQALAEAQALGYAEVDPTFDVKGHDSAHKLAILMGLAFHHRFNYTEISKEGIDGINPIDFEYAKEFGYTLKLLAIAKNTSMGYEGRVHPTLIPSASTLASVNNEYNAVEVLGNYSGSVVAYGKGAGPKPTASAVVSDLVGMYEYEMLHSPLDGPEEKYFFENRQARILPLIEIKSKFYIRFTVKDKIGVMSTISHHLSREKISISQMIQKRIPGVNNVVNLTLITDICQEKQIHSAFKRISYEDFVKNSFHLYRIEEIPTTGFF